MSRLRRGLMSLGQGLDAAQPWARMALFVSLLVSAALLFTVAITIEVHSQTPGITPEFTAYMTSELARRISTLEALQLDKRIGILEDNITQLKLLSGGVAITVLAQLVVSGMGIRKGRAGG